MTFAAMDFWRRRGASDEPASSVLRRMQAASAGAEGDVRLFQVAGNRRGAVPQTRAAVDAFLAVEIRHTVVPQCDGLAAAPKSGRHQRDLGEILFESLLVARGNFPAHDFRLRADEEIRQRHFGGRAAAGVSSRGDITAISLAANRR